MLLLPFLNLSVHTASGQTESAAPPDAEFLEFLGEWQTDEGEWIDPEEMEDEYLAGQVETMVMDDEHE